MVRNINDIRPTAGLEVAPFGILSPATTTYDETDGFWLNGFTYEAMDAGVKIYNGTIAGVSPSEEVIVVDNTDNTQHFKYYLPFDVKASVKVSTMGTNPADIEAAATRALNTVTQKAVESEFWNGTLTKLLTDDNDNRYLASTQSVDVTPVSGSAVKPRYGLAILEQALAESSIGAQGVIHATRDAATTLRLDHDGKTLFTTLGTPVVAGVGYSKTGPTGAAAGTGKAWMYATGPISVRLGPTQIVPGNLNQAINTRINEIEYFVDRPAAVTWSTTDSYAVLVDLTLDYA